MKVAARAPERGAPAVPRGYSSWVHRGPAREQGAIPARVLDRTTWEEPFDQHMETESFGERDVALKCDVAVIGSGAGGAAAALELSSKGLDVIVVEEGAYFRKPDFAGTPIERVLKLYAQGGATMALGRVSIPIPFGKTVGGTTTINSGTCFRAPRKVLTEWERMAGVEGIDYDSMDPYFNEAEDMLNVRPVPWELLGPTGWFTYYGAKKLGLTGGPILRNIADCHGMGQCAFGCPTDAKQAMHLSYLPRAWRAGARILERTRADWITIERGRASGIIARSLSTNGRSLGRVEIRARRVMIACGAIGTPMLLLRNKIGNASRQVGRNLRIHPATGVAGIFDAPVYGWRGTLQPFYVDSLFNTNDAMLEATNTVPSVGANVFTGYGLDLKEQIARFAHIATLGLLVSDTSKGRVIARRGEPIILYNLNARDLANLYEGLGLAARIMLAAGATKVSAGVFGFDAIIDEKGIEELRRGEKGSRGLKLSAFHPMGTARMGSDPETSVVDGWLESHEVPGLYITDASVFPSCLGVNPQMTIMAFATRTARRISEEMV